VTRYVTRRVALAIVVVAGVVILTFVISDVVPGDPAASWAGPHASAAQIARARHYLGLDQPLAVRIGKYFAGIVSGTGARPSTPTGRCSPTSGRRRRPRWNWSSPR
jgi:ABC-type dipeptide/oligopeptide/nickel transport systems, permease components